MDLDGTNLPDLKKTIENRYPDVQVSCRVVASLLESTTFRLLYNKPTLPMRMLSRVSANRPSMNKDVLTFSLPM